MIRNYQNLPISRKLFLGFGTIVLLIAVLILVSFVTGRSVNQDLARVGELSQLQTDSAEMVEAFSQAQGHAQVVFSKLRQEEHYQQCQGYLRQARERLNAMLASSQGGAYQAEVGALDQELRAWEAAVAQARQLQLKLEADSDVLFNNSQTIADNAILIHDLVTMLVAERALTESGAWTAERIENVVMPAGVIGSAAILMQLESARLALDYDPESIGKLQTTIATIRATSAQMSQTVTTVEAREALLLIAENLDAYEASLNDFAVDMNAVAAEIGVASVSMEALFRKIATLNEQISGQVNTLLQGGISSSNRANLVMMAVAVLAGLAALAIAVQLSRNLKRRIRLIQQVLSQIGEAGRVELDEALQAQLDRESEIEDELGSSIRNCRDLLQQFRYWAACLQRIAEGDLSLEVELLSAEDALGHALRQTSDSLNRMFEEIRAVSTQVAAGATQIAMGSSNLATGATAQSSTIQEISSSLQEINRKSDANMHTARLAARDSAAIRESARHGNDCMVRMVRAMEELNLASHAIAQVIKAIDDIAFQTNILALNASVEAARAGSYGQGFGVVAEEVRNLASKSAEAAKQTANLIDSNIEKAEMGLAISRETAASLEEIIRGIQKTSESLETVLQQSEGVTSATAAVNSAVEQVAHVVSQNSATSEESAAASQQMSGQAQALQELLAHFKLKDALAAVRKAAAPWDLGDGDDDFDLLAGSKY